MLSIETLAIVLQANFRPPFTQAGRVKVELRREGRRKCISIKIGRRDVCIDSDGTVHAAGTDFRGLPRRRKRQITHYTKKQAFGANGR